MSTNLGINPIRTHQYFFPITFISLLGTLFHFFFLPFQARKLKIKNIDFEKKTALIIGSKRDKDRLIYIAEDVCEMCQQMLDRLQQKYNFYSEYLFSSSNPDIPLEVASINTKFKEFWKKTSEHVTPDILPYIPEIQFCS